MYTLRVHRLMVYIDIRRIPSQTVAPTRSAEFLSQTRQILSTVSGRFCRNTTQTLLDA